MCRPAHAIHFTFHFSTAEQRQEDENTGVVQPVENLYMGGGGGDDGSVSTTYVISVK